MLKKQRFLHYYLQGIENCRNFAVQTTKKSDKQTKNIINNLKQNIMKTIEKKMLNALRENKSVSLANTFVSVSGEEKAVYLHNNKIALFTCGKLYVSLCGWNSVTTRSRLRALGVNITTKQGTPYIGGKSVSNYGVYEIDRYTGNLA